MGEFELIAEKFLPLTENCQEALGLKDDTALLPGGLAGDLAVSVDSLVENVHFLADDPPDTVGEKLLRVNLSDLAAMGASPYGYLMALSLGPARLENEAHQTWLDGIVEGLARTQRAFGLRLFGGDTTKTDGPTTFSITIFGRLFKPPGLCRNLGRVGDDLYVSGTLGDGALGLAALRGKLDGLTPGERAALVRAYRLPEARIELGRALLTRGLCRAAMDISDGLMADAAHLARASGVRAEVFSTAVPRSSQAQAAMDLRPDMSDLPFCGGDDYELLFAAPPENRAAIADLSLELGVKVTAIGRLTAGQGAILMSPDGEVHHLKIEGWQHF